MKNSGPKSQPRARSRHRRRGLRIALSLAALLMAAAVAAHPRCALAMDSAPVGDREHIAEPWYIAGSQRHMASIFPSRVVRRSGPVLVLPRAQRDLSAVFYEWNGRRHSLDELLARTYTAGFLVIKDGNIVDERYFGGADENSSFTSWSMAKSVTSTLVGIAIAEGRISGVDAPVSGYIPELAGSGYDGVPIRDLLDMSSGVDFSEVYINPESTVEKMWWEAMVRETRRLNDFAVSIRRAEPPGTRFAYRSLDTQVLGWMLTRVAGKPLADYLSEKIWAPLGMEHDAAWLTDRPGPDGMEAAYCCLNASLRDYGRFGLMILNRGRLNGREIAPERWIREATRPAAAPMEFGRLDPGYPLGYGYQWWLLPGPDHAFAAAGINFQFIYINPAANLVIVKTSAFPTPWNTPLEMETYAAFAAIGHFLTSDANASGRVVGD